MRDDTDTLSPRPLSETDRALTKQLGWWRAVAIVAAIIALFAVIVALEVIRPWEANTPSLGCPATVQPAGR